MDQAARYSVQERIKNVEAYFVTESVVVQTTIWEKLSRQKRSNQIHNKAPPGLIKGRGSLHDNIEGRSSWPRSVRTENHIVTVKQCLKQSPRKSTRLLCQGTDLSWSSVMHIKHQYLHLFPGKIQILQLGRRIEDHPDFLDFIFQWRGKFPPECSPESSREWSHEQT